MHCLYFSQRKYTETVYVGQPAGTPVLQVHAMRDNTSERRHFLLCSLNPFRVSQVYSSWFNLDVNTGVLSLNKTLEESDFAGLGEEQSSWQKQMDTLTLAACRAATSAITYPQDSFSFQISFSVSLEDNISVAFYAVI